MARGLVLPTRIQVATWNTGGVSHTELLGLISALGEDSAPDFLGVQEMWTSMGDAETFFAAGHGAILAEPTWDRPQTRATGLFYRGQWHECLSEQCTTDRPVLGVFGKLLVVSTHLPPFSTSASQQGAFARELEAIDTEVSRLQRSWGPLQLVFWGDFNTELTSVHGPHV